MVINNFSQKYFCKNVILENPFFELSQFIRTLVKAKVLFVYIQKIFV